MTRKEQLKEVCKEIKEIRNKLYLAGIKHDADRVLLKRIDSYLSGDTNALKVSELGKVLQLKTNLMVQGGLVQ